MAKCSEPGCNAERENGRMYCSAHQPIPDRGRKDGDDTNKINKKLDNGFEKK